MERLTEKHYLGTDHYMVCSGDCNADMDCIDCPAFDRLVERLAAYEDTGLEPEDMKKAFNENAVLKLAGEMLGMEPDRLRELAAREKAAKIPGTE
nr:MAG TPA: hypothetical protein [Caudoviricetes sp.]